MRRAILLGTHVQHETCIRTVDTRAWKTSIVLFLFCLHIRSKITRWDLLTPGTKWSKQKTAPPRASRTPFCATCMFLKAAPPCPHPLCNGNYKRNRCVFMTPFGVHVGFWQWNLVSLLNMCWHFSAEQVMADILYNTHTLCTPTLKWLTSPALHYHLGISALTENSTVIYVIMASYIFLWPPLYLCIFFAMRCWRTTLLMLAKIIYSTSAPRQLWSNGRWPWSLESAMVIMVIRVHHGHHETKYSMAHQRQSRSFH